jgi:hypothetical protein
MNAANAASVPADISHSVVVCPPDNASLILNSRQLHVRSALHRTISAVPLSGLRSSSEAANCLAVGSDSSPGTPAISRSEGVV